MHFSWRFDFYRWKTAGYYETTYSVAATSNTPAHNLAIYITQAPTRLAYGSNGGNYLWLMNRKKQTLFVAKPDASNATTNYKNIATTGVIYSIDKALIYNQIDVK